MPRDRAGPTGSNRRIQPPRPPQARRLRRGSFISLDHLADAIDIWTEAWNTDPTPFTWTARAEGILTKVERARQALRDPGIRVLGLGECGTAAGQSTHVRAVLSGLGR